jgi:hypothetical protein
VGAHPVAVYARVRGRGAAAGARQLDRDVRHRDVRHRDVRHRDVRHRDVRHRDVRHRDVSQLDSGLELQDSRALPGESQRSAVASPGSPKGLQPSHNIPRINIGEINIGGM